MAVITGGSIGSRGVDDEAGLDLAGFGRLLWRAKWLILACVALSCALAVNMVLGSGGNYTARMVVQSAGQQSATGVAGAIGQIGSLIGGGGGMAEDREFSQFQALLKSTLMAERLQAKYGMMQEVFGGQWDPVNKRWIEPTGWRHEIGGKLRAYRGLQRWIPPSIYDLADHIGTSVLIKKTASNSIYEISYKSGNRDFAVRFLDLLHKETEAALREDRKARVMEQARYLRSRIETTPIMEYRLSLISLLSDQDKTLMLLESSLPFATNVIDPVHAALRVEAPSFSVYAFAGIFGGLFVAIALVFIYAIGRQAIHGRL